MNRRFSLPYLMGIIASIPNRFAAAAACALCALMLAVPTWGQVITISPETTTVQEEDEDEVVLTITADSDPSNRLIVTYTVSGTAKAGYDYKALETTEVVFTGTNTSASVTIAIMDDHADEGDTDETIIVTLGAMIGGDNPSLGATKVATINIDDDDAADEPTHVTFINANKEALSKIVVDEGGDAVMYMVALSAEPKANVTLEVKEYVAMQGTATEDEEEEGRLTITPSTLMFTDKNWETGQAVAVSAGIDENDTDETVMISHKPMGDDFEDDVQASLLTVDVVDQENPSLVAVRLSEKSQNVSPREDTYGVGEKILLEAEFSKPVKVVGSPQLKVLVGDAKDRLAQYMPPGAAAASQGPSAIVTFAYTVQGDDEDEDGISVPDANPLVLGADDAIMVNAKNDDAPILTMAPRGSFTVDIPAAVTKVDGEKDFMLRAFAGDDQAVTEDKAVRLDGSDTTTGDAANIRYVWKFKGSNAPDWLTVSDPVTLEGSGDEDDLVTPAGDVIALGTTKVTLEGKTVSFSPNNILAENVALTFELIVTNTRTRETSRDEVAVSISAEDDAPVANAGSNITAEEGTVVFLIGSDSADPEGDDLTYSWRLKSGDRKYILAEHAFDSEVAAIELHTNITGSPKLVFELTVTDKGGTSNKPSPASQVEVTIVTSRLGEVLEHSLSRFGYTLGSSAVDALAERFGPRLGHSSSGMTMNSGDIQVSFGGTASGIDALSAVKTALSMPQGMAYAEDGVDSAVDESARSAANNMSGINSTQPFAASHFDERLRMRSNNFNPFKFANLDRQAITGSNFEFSMGGADALGAFFGSGGNGMKFGLWGRFDSRSFEADPTRTTTLDATTNIGYVGGDVRLGANQNIVVGLAVSTAESEIDYTQSSVEGFARGLIQAISRAIEEGEDVDDLDLNNAIEGEITFDMTTFYPYASMNLSDTVSVWGVIGVGSGDAEITSTVGHLIETDISMTMLAIGGRGELQSMGATDFAFKADAFMVNTDADDAADRDIEDIETAVRRLRGGLEASRLFPMGDDSYLRGNVELAIRMDTGDAESGLGIEVHAGAAYESDMGLAVEGRVRHLVMHTSDDVAETGFSIIGRFDPAGVGGPSFTFTPTWGDMASVADVMWQGDQPMFYDDLTGQDSDANPFRMNTQLQYAFLTRKWSIAPYGMFTTGDAYERERFGLHITSLAMTNGNISLDFFGEQVGVRTSGTIEPGVQAAIRLRLR